MSVPTPVTTMIITPESRSTTRPHPIEMRARPSSPVTAIQGSPRNWRTCPRTVQEKAIAATASEPIIAPIATRPTLARPRRRPTSPFTIAPASGNRMMAHK